MKVSELFDRALALNTGSRHQLLATIAERDPDAAKELERLLLADANPLLPEPSPEMARNLPGLKPAVDTVIGGFTIIERIGEGGMGEVWLAQRQVGSARQKVALKLLRLNMQQPEAKRRFREEQSIIARLNHPYVARLVDAGEGPDGSPWLAMEYVQGMPITDWCDHRRLPVRQRLRLFLKVLEAVRHAHQQLVVHRDIKPSNVLVDDDGMPRLLDFGISKLLGQGDLTNTGHRYFSMGSVAPEQLRGEHSTVTADIYQLGILLYELLAGRAPFRAFATPAKMQDDILHHAPELPSKSCTEAAANLRGCDRIGQLVGQLRGELDRIVLHALRKGAQERYPDTAEFAMDIEAFLDGRPVRAVGQGPGYRARKFVRRHALVFSIIGVAGVALLLLVVQLLLRDGELRVARQVALQSRDVATIQRDRAAGLNEFLLDLFRAASPTAGNRRDISAVVLEAIDLQLARRDFSSEPDVLFALIKAALGLGENDAARRALQRLLQWQASFSIEDRRQFWLLRANLANIDGKIAALDEALAALAPLMAGAPPYDQTLYIGFQGQVLIGSQPEAVITLTDIDPLPTQLIRLRARALLATGQSEAALALLRSARERVDLTALERLSVLQTLTRLELEAGNLAEADRISGVLMRNGVEVLGVDNLRMVPYANIRATVLARLGKTRDSLEIYDHWLARPELSPGLARTLRINRLLTGSSADDIDETTIALIDDLLAQPDIGGSALNYVMLAAVRVRAYQGRTGDARELAQRLGEVGEIGDSVAALEIRGWRQVLLPSNAAEPVLSSKTLQGAGSVDRQLLQRLP